MEALTAGDPVEVGPYRVLGRLGATEFAQVYLGQASELELVAVTVPRAGYGSSPRLRRRLTRDLTMARTVRNRWIARIVAADLDGARPWWASEYVAGPSLRRVVGEVGLLGEAVVGLVGARLAAALAELHAGGVLHSLLRPSSVLVAADGPRLINFGVSRCVEAAEVVMWGVAMDSPAFLSTEQALGASPGAASDVFSLASVLVYAATGDGPFGVAGNPLAVVRRVAGGRVDLSRVPGQLTSELGACLVGEPSARPSAAELAHHMAHWADEPMAEAWPSACQRLWINTI